jgi:N-formylglutamate amidohydrolase
VTGGPGPLAFEILAPDGPARPIVGHVPHAGIHVPPRERAGLLLDDPALAAELLRMTDRHTDRLYAWIRGLGGSMIVNRVSRVVVDPERFPDDAAEPMAAAGQGAVYLRTSGGALLRDDDPRERARLMARWYIPYHAALTGLVEASLTAFGRCLVIDGHSFASVPLPAEPDQDPARPDVCLGTDPVHTPRRLVAALREALEADGFRVAVDRPFAGVLVPLRWYGADARVTGVMLEVRRGTYMDEATGEPLPALGGIPGCLERAVTAALAVMPE